MRSAVVALLLIALLLQPAIAIPRALWEGMDWGSIPPLAEDPRDDHRFGDVDLKALYITHDSEYLYIKVDHHTQALPTTNYEFSLDLLEPTDDVVGFATNFFPRGTVLWYETKNVNKEFARVQARPGGAAIMYRGTEVQIRIPLNLTKSNYRFKVQLTVWPSGDFEEGSDRIDNPEWTEYPPGGGEAPPVKVTLLPTAAPATTPTPVPVWQGVSWQGVAPLATDAQGDHDMGTDLRSLAIKEDTEYIYIKVDLHTDSNNPFHIYDILFDTDGDARADYAANIKLSKEYHFYQHTPSLRELPTEGMAVVFGRNWMQARIPKLSDLSEYRTAVRVWPAGTNSPQPGDMLYETGWSEPGAGAGSGDDSSTTVIVGVVVLVLLVAIMLGRGGAQQA